MSQKAAEEFFEKLKTDEKLKTNIKQGLEVLAKLAGFDATEEELTEELAKQWKCGPKLFHPPYSEPPGF